MTFSRKGRTNVVYRGMQTSVVRGTNDSLIKNRAARAQAKEEYS